MDAAGIRDLIEGLPSRYRSSPQISGRFRLFVDSVSTDVVVDGQSCSVESVSGRCEAEIRTDSDTWAAIDAGKISGMEAFAAGSLDVRGSIDKALQFEPLFERAQAGALSYSLKDVRVGSQEISMLEAGPPSAPVILLLHGLGATKASWLPVVPPLAQEYRVLAVDLPGFGSSSKPRGKYDARWFAQHMFSLLDEVGADRAYVAGNSMGGRIAMEMAIENPEIVAGVACLCPATAFSKRPLVRLVRLSRPELGVVAAALPRSQVRELLLQLFADSSRLPESWYEAAIDDFLRTWRSPRARMAFFAAARNIYLEEPEGEMGFWVRLATMRSPAVYVYGSHDLLITPRFARRVSRFLPSAQVEVWDDCGHVPQIEHPARTTRLLLSFLAGQRSRQVAGVV